MTRNGLTWHLLCKKLDNLIAGEINIYLYVYFLFTVSKLLMFRSMPLSFNHSNHLMVFLCQCFDCPVFGFVASNHWTVETTSSQTWEELTNNKETRIKCKYCTYPGVAPSPPHVIYCLGRLAFTCLTKAGSSKLSLYPQPPCALNYSIQAFSTSINDVVNRNFFTKRLYKYYFFNFQNTWLVFRPKKTEKIQVLKFSRPTVWFDWASVHTSRAKDDILEFQFCLVCQV